MTLSLPVDAEPGEYLNRTSQVTADFDGSPVTVNGAEDSLNIVTPLTFSKSFIDDPALSGGTVTLSYTITNDNPVSAADNISFSDDFGSILTGLAATGLPLNDVCGSGVLDHRNRHSHTHRRHLIRGRIL